MAPLNGPKWMKQLSPDRVDRGPDYWTLLLSDAVTGRSLSVLTLARQLEGCTPESERGALFAVAARAFVALDMHSAAERYLDRALEERGLEGAAVATFQQSDGVRWAKRRMEQGRPGEQADAACDLAVLHLEREDDRAAREAVHEALQRCPEHAEASRWYRFFAEAGPRLHSFWVGRGPPAHPAARDAAELRPCPGYGWLSAERWSRRITSGAWVAPARPGSALDRLQIAGVVGRRFALPAEYDARPATLPLTTCELALDHAESLVREGRPAGAAAAQVWTSAGRIDPTACADAAQHLVALGVRCPAAASTGLRAVDHLLQRCPVQPLWLAYRSCLLATVGQHREAIDRARAVGAMGQLAPLTLSLLVVASRRAGNRVLADALLERRAQSPALSATVRVLRQEPFKDELPVVVSDRRIPRFAERSPTLPSESALAADCAPG